MTNEPDREKLRKMIGDVEFTLALTNSLSDEELREYAAAELRKSARENAHKMTELLRKRRDEEQ